MKALIFGLGVSGLETIKFLDKKGWEISIYDDDAKKLSEFGKKYSMSSKDSVPEKTDVLIVSPGVPGTHPLILDAIKKKVEIAGEMEFAARFLTSEKVIAVTGTNGKSTTVTLIHDILKKAGEDSYLCGNIGVPMITGVEKGHGFLVVEISSFQLETLESLHPDVSMILNVTPDHLDRYKNYEEYLMTKVKLGRLLKKGGLLVVNGGDEPLCAAVACIKGEKHLFSSGGKSDAIFESGKVTVGEFAIDMEKTALRGEHNVENVMAALLGVTPFVKDAKAVQSAIYGFKPLRHRMELVDSFDGVTFIDDSKGTNVGAVEKSLSGFPERSVVLILGGVDKGGSYEPLRLLADKKCKGVVLIGASAPLIAEYFEGFDQLDNAGSMKEAVEKAYKMADGSGTVLLSPACSSFDWYENYKKRGDDFIEQVKALKKAGR